MIGLSVFAIACSSAADPTARPGNTPPNATAIATVDGSTRPSSTPEFRPGPTPGPDGAPTPFGYRPEIMAVVPATGPTVTESGLTVTEVLRRSKEHAATVTSFRYRPSNPLRGVLDQDSEASSDFYIEYIRPYRSRSVDSFGTAQTIAIGGTVYRQSSNGDGKWWKIQEINEIPPAELDPTTYIPFDLAGASFIDLDDPEYFLIEGYASPLSRSDARLQIGSELLGLHRLKIRKSDFAFMSSTTWVLPLLVEDGETVDQTVLLVRQAEIKSGPLDVGTEFFDYNIEIDIQPPAEWFTGILSTIPRSERSVPINSEISYTITEPVEIAEVSISPPVQLSLDSETQLNGGPVRRVYKPDSPLERETEYTVTLTWGTSEQDLQTITWTFTTAKRLAPLSQ